MRRPELLQISAEGAVQMPDSLLDRAGWSIGDTLFAIDTEHGVLLLSRSDAEAVTSARLDGHDLLTALMLDRRQEAARDEEPGAVNPHH